MCQKQRNTVIDSMDESQIGGISKIVGKFLRSDKMLTKRHVVKRLHKNINTLIDLGKTNRKVSSGKKKEIMKQAGGFLPFLLPLLLGSIM